MTVDTCTPISWAVLLRFFGKQIRDNTISLGYIQWSDDEQTVYCKDIELSIHGFRCFVTMQVRRVNNLLLNILMLGPDEAREDVIPVIYLHRLRNNPAVVENRWNSLQDDRNKTFLPCKHGWLLRRVLQNDRLRKRFTYPSKSRDVLWDTQAVRKYSQTDWRLSGRNFAAGPHRIGTTCSWLRDYEFATHEPYGTTETCSSRMA